jgi:hypothetical protein
MNRGGCILLARKMLDSDLMDQSPLVVKLWVWLLLKANWKDRDQLARGQLVTTIAEMQQAMSFYSGWKKTVPTKDEIRSAYGALSKATRLTVRRTTRGMVITILNYDAYQNALAYASHTAPVKEIARQPSATPHDTESLNQEDYSSSFSTFWNAYPRKVGKAQALKSWQKIKADSSLQKQILSALEWQSQQTDWQKDGGKFIPHPATWLNGRRWEDEQPVKSNVIEMGGYIR